MPTRYSALRRESTWHSLVNLRNGESAFGGNFRLLHFQQLQAQLTQWEALLKVAKDKDLQRTLTPISISQWIKLRMGDTLRVVIFHQDRHFEQMEGLLRRL